MRARFVLAFSLAILPAAAAPTPLLTADGLAPFRIGMTETEIRRIPGLQMEFHSEASGDAESCETALISGMPDIDLMLVHHRIVKIGTNAPAIRTSDGVHIGTTEAQLKAIFGRRAVFKDQPYEEGDPNYHWVIVKVQGQREFLFATSKHIVDSLNVGDLPGIEFMEGCA
jgi:hypothetical protein